MPSAGGPGAGGFLRLKVPEAPRFDALAAARAGLGMDIACHGNGKRQGKGGKQKRMTHHGGLFVML
jgi:hypothetical protein